MSHFTNIKTKFANGEYLQKALSDLGYTVETGPIRGYAGRKTTAEFKVSGDVGYDIGFVKSGSTYDVVADWYGIKKTNKELLVSSLLQRYAYHATRSELEQQGFDIATEQVETDGRIHLVLRRTQ